MLARGLMIWQQWSNLSNLNISFLPQKISLHLPLSRIRYWRQFRTGKRSNDCAWFFAVNLVLHLCFFFFFHLRDLSKSKYNNITLCDCSTIVCLAGIMWLKDWCSWASLWWMHLVRRCLVNIVALWYWPDYIIMMIVALCITLSSWNTNVRSNCQPNLVDRPLPHAGDSCRWKRFAVA